MSSSSVPAQVLGPSRARQILVWTRRAVLLYAVCGAVYLYWRFDVQSLPREGDSPLLAFRPGAQLLIDRKHKDGRAGDVLLFRDELGRLLLGRVSAPPSPQTRAGVWLLADNPQVSLLDSRTLGPIARNHIVGRVVCALPGME